jgi:hypothetical protein
MFDVLAIAYSRDATMLVSGSSDKIVRLWSASVRTSARTDVSCRAQLHYALPVSYAAQHQQQPRANVTPLALRPKPYREYFSHSTAGCFSTRVLTVHDRLLRFPLLR